MRIGAVAVLAAVLLAACGGDDDGGAAPRGSTRTADGATPARDEPESPGAALYDKACVMCHGVRGAGTHIGSALNDRARTVDEVVAAVQSGVTDVQPPHAPMPPRGDGTYTDQDARTVAEYVHSLAR